MRWAAILLVVPIGCREAPAPSRLVVAYPAGPETLLPHLAHDEYTMAILSNVYEPLVELDGDLALRPALAEAWYTPDESSWVFRLRAGARLHDGRPLEAREVALSLERARSDPRSRRQAELTAVSAIEAPDPRTVVVRTRFPFAPLPNRLASAPIWADPVRAGESPVGTGPYRVKSGTSGGDTVLEAVEGGRDSPPSIRLLEFRVVRETGEQIALLKRGDVDLVGEVPLEQVSALRSLPGVRLTARKGLLVLFLAMDCSRETSPYVSGPRNPFRDQRVREAVALAIDREALVRGALAGQGEVVDQIVGPQVFGYHDRLPPRPFDPGRSRRLLAEAGHAAGFDVDLDFLNSESARDSVLAALVKDLAQVGIRVRPRPSDGASLLRRIESRQTALYLMPWISTSGDAGLSADYLLHTPGGGYGVDNGGGYSSPEVDRLLEAASRQLQADARRLLLHAMAVRVHADVPVVPLYRRTDLYATASGLSFVPRLDRQIRGSEIRWAASR